MAASHDDAIARRTSPRTLIRAGVSLVGAFLMLGIQSAARTASTSANSTNTSPKGTPGWFFGLFALLLVVQAVVVVVTWLMRTYTVTGSELVIDEGVITRHHRVIPYARVQQVDLEQKLMLQILGIQVVKISSAGESGATTIALHALETQDAQSLRAFILRRREELHQAAHATAAPHAPQPPAGGVGVGDVGRWVVDGSGGTSAPPMPPVPGSGPGPQHRATPPPPPMGPPAELLRLSPGRLVVAALTDLRLWAIPAVVVFLFLVLASIAVVRDEPAAAAPGVALVIGMVILLPLLLISQTIQRYGFTVTLHGGDLHLRYGLFEVRELTVPRQRVQQLTIIDNPVRRVLGLASLRLHSATTSGGPESTHFDIPLVDTRDLDQFLRSLMGTDTWQVPALTPRNDRARIRAITRRVGLLAGLVVIPAIVLKPNGPALLLIALAGIPWGLLAHKRAGHGRTSAVVAFAHGALDHRIDLIPIDRIQSCRVRTSPFQRRAKVATFHADVAAARIAPYLFDIDDAVARHLVQVLPRESSPPAAADQRF